MSNRIALPTFTGAWTEDWRRRVQNFLTSAVFTQTTTITAAGTTALQFTPTTVLCDATLGNQTLTLPRATDIKDGSLFIKKIDLSTNTVTLTPQGSDLIDGNSTFVLGVQNQSILLCSDGGAWRILADADASEFSGALNVRTHGAKGDGVTDDAPAINAAILASKIVYFPPGVYRCLSPIQVIDNNANNHRWGVRLIGSNGGASGAALDCVLEWNGGSTTTPFIQLYARDLEVEGLAIRCASGKTVPALIDIDNPTGTGAGISTNVTLRRCYITQGSGTATDGVRIGNTAATNCDYHALYDTYIVGVTSNCVNIVGASGQSKHNAFYRSAFVTAAVGINHQGGAFRTYHCAFGSCTDTAVKITNASDPIAICDTDEESCNRMLVSTGGSNAYWPVTLRGGRFALNSMNADGLFVDYTYGGPLLIENCMFDLSFTYSSIFKVRAHVADPGSVLVSIGNSFPTDTPYITDATKRFRLISMGNNGLTSGGVMTHVPDQIEQYVVSTNTTGFFAYPQKRVAPAYGANVVINTTLGNEFDIVANNGTAFNINNPTQVTILDGQQITITIKNTAGGALGVATFSANYHLAGAWVQPANTFNRSVTFRYDGAVWHELYRTAADVAN
jgi:hypothetical protein